MKNHLEALEILSASLCHSGTSAAARALRFGASGRDDVLVRDDAGGVELLPADPDSGDAGGSRSVIASLRQIGAPGPKAAIALVTAEDSLLVNGAVVPGIALLRPGATLSFEGREWLIVRRYAPSPGPVSEELKDTPCPVCGMPLSAARDGMVCACPCGAHYHMEAGAGDSDDSDEDLLQCFSAIDRCRVCGTPTSLEERVLPDPASMGFGALPSESQRNAEASP